jgi:general secretion pathway protein D
VAGVQEPAALEIVPVRHRPSRELERLLCQVAGPYRKGAPPVRVISDERTNSLIIHGSDADRRRLRELAAELDRE